jgi:molybdate transport system substrate-binding protein
VKPYLSGFLFALLVALLALPAAASDKPVVAAAADLQFALTDIAAAFTKATGKEVRLTFGSSGNFYRQIGQGAPFDLFFSADEDFVFNLAKEGRTEDEGALYAIGRIVLLLPHGSPLKADPALGDLRAAIGDGRLRRFAIANPEHAPYGLRAEEALRQAGIWDAIKDRLVLGENVSQAAQFVLSGNAQGGIVAYSLALAPELAAKADHVLIPEDMHEPLRQRMVALKGASPTAREFLAFMQREEARAVMRHYGFVLPGEEM